MTHSKDGTADRSTEPREDLKSLRQASEKARDPEVVARLVRLAMLDNPQYVIGIVERSVKQDRIARVYAAQIIAILPDALPLIEALEGAEKAMEPFAIPLHESYAGIDDGQPFNSYFSVGAIRQISAALTQIRRTLNHD